MDSGCLQKKHVSINYIWCWSTLLYTRIRWEEHFLGNPMMRNNDNYTNFALISNISPTQNPALTSFENEIYSMVKNIEFMKDRYDFQDKFKEDTNELRSSKNLYVLADKLANLYKMSDTDHNRLLDNNITSNYRKIENGAK